MKVLINKESGELNEYPDRLADIFLKRNPKKYDLAEVRPDVKPEPTTQTELSGSVVKEPKQEVVEEPQSIEEINGAMDATRGAIKAANEAELNLNDLNIEGRIQLTDVQNYLSK